MRCNSGKRSGDVFNDYLDLLHGVACDESSIQWTLSYLVTFIEYELWQRHMEEGFSRCDTYEFADDNTCLVLALRRMNEEVTRWWTEELSGRDDIPYATWHDLKFFCIPILYLLIAEYLLHHL